VVETTQPRPVVKVDDAAPRNSSEGDKRVDTGNATQRYNGKRRKVAQHSRVSLTMDEDDDDDGGR